MKKTNRNINEMAIRRFFSQRGYVDAWQIEGCDERLIKALVEKTAVPPEYLKAVNFYAKKFLDGCNYRSNKTADILNAWKKLTNGGEEDEIHPE